nr:hypothetical protein [Lysinibacillus timonensis]
MKRFLMLILSIWLIIFSMPNKPLATSWAYPFVVWDGYIYVVSEEYVTGVAEEIGHVTKYSDMEQHAGNFSNSYREGTKYYAIIGVSTDVAIAIQEDTNQYRKAVREGKYEYSNGFLRLIGWILGGIVMLIMIALGINYLEDKARKHN